MRADVQPFGSIRDATAWRDCRRLEATEIEATRPDSVLRTSIDDDGACSNPITRGSVRPISRQGWIQALTDVDLLAGRIRVVTVLVVESSRTAIRSDVSIGDRAWATGPKRALR